MLERLECHGVPPEQAAGAIEGNFLAIGGAECPSGFGVRRHNDQWIQSFQQQEQRLAVERGIPGSTIGP